MPPQTRGGSPEPGQRPFSQSESLPPTLRPYLENLPCPNPLIPDQRTPTGPRMVTPDRDIATPTPSPKIVRSNIAATFELGIEGEEIPGEDGRGENVQEESDGEVAGVTLDDDDFESHYSRQESSASEEEGSEEDGDVDEQHQNGTAAEGGSYFPSSADRPDSLSRVRSLPARPPPSDANGQAQGPSHPHPPFSGLHTSQSTTSLPPPPPPPLYPPFYNRPPTPLPPSPSLTSLLRPPSLLNRSATSTRPTTPDSSDVETPNDTEAAVAHSARRAHPLPPTSPKVPTYEYYGFVLYLASSLAFLIYILWSYLPSPFLHALGITYYPNRWWSLAIPAWIVVLLIFIYVALLSYNVEYLTLPLSSLECMVDEAGNVAVLDESGRVMKGGSKRLVKELEERAKMEKHREMETAKIKGGKGRKYSKGTHRSKDKRKQRSSRTNSEHVESPPPEIPTRDYQYSSSSNPNAHSSPFSHTTYPYSFPSTYPFLTSNTHPSQIQHEVQSQGSHPADPNWKLIWNEGTDAVMDVPIGGVCEVLYG
ncbi:uncharacterized protein Z518_00054 [Rhinocladiella mackenziei CBS 650.93]|uniref:PIG-P domain-containing protein n=1 Tax=Rhinocladiella mackenziei CBS 650.93 TaxID=1442369 RepID=A0A0D2J021_9EURO|nr:uncharacterized protein Z518_00054 [Rhinocladiella mackenziei CBS 650.93]KIX08976.1 hypothetical protein Z518_00054 [Rhinocladiella mackenziei CBS 650.93]